MSLPTVAELVQWARDAETAPTVLERLSARGLLVAAYARAKAKAEGADEHTAVMAALKETREKPRLEILK